MNKILKEVIEHAETWPQEDQEELAEYAREIEARRTGVYTMSDDERAAVRRGLAEADRGEFVRAKSLPTPTSATTDEDTLYARCLLRQGANNPILTRTICWRREQRGGKHSRGSSPAQRPSTQRLSDR
jgi:hypothetical protein